ncbi:hypothetical protein IH824_08890 [candidate division KSB1 bacterium]|nr:hypothetical protein [candidate division KSB1 bacterium]
MNSSSMQDPSLQKPYVRKVMRGLKKIRIALALVHDNPNNRDACIEIRNTAQSISELAMVHGYHGVESIALKIYTSFKRSRIKSDPDFLYKIELAVKGIQRVVGMEGRIESKLKVTRGGKEVSKQISSLDELNEEQRQMVELESDAKLLFDIRESDFLNNIPGMPISKNIEPILRATRTGKIPS